MPYDLDRLIKRLQELKAKHGNIKSVELLSEHPETKAQVQQPVGDLAVSNSASPNLEDKTVILLPENF